MEKVKDDLLGTCQSIATVVERHELECQEDEVEDRLLDEPNAVELCGVCNWWHNPCDLEWNDELNAGVCDQCKE